MHIMGTLRQNVPINQIGVCHVQCKVMDAAFLSVTDVCQYRKVHPFNGGSPLIQPSAYDFHFSWNQVPYAVGKKRFLFTM